MHLIAPDVLTEARGLAPAVSACAGVVGLLLWLCGWHWHRFWVVVAVTVGGGLVGLHSGRTGGGHVLALGVLLAVSAGVLALELARVIAFLAGGMTVWAAASTLLPAARELWVVFLAGGLVGVLLYRLWTMLLTSFAGVLLAGHAGLCLLEWATGLDAADWAARNDLLANGSVIAATFGGLAGQSLIERMHAARGRRRQEAAIAKIRAEERERAKAEMPPPSPPAPPPGLWQRLLGKKNAA